MPRSEPQAQRPRKPHAALAAVLAATLTVAGAAAVPDAAHAQGYGAIAYSPPTNHWGWASGHPTRAAAEARALAECHNLAGRGCQGALWFNNACGALAVGASGWGTGWGDSQARASSEAMAVCRRYSRNCVVQLRVCSP